MKEAYFSNEYQVFRAIYSFKSLTKAALHLGNSPGNLSRMLSNLEAEIGALLFKRHRNGLTPLPNAVKLMQSLEAAKLAFSQVYFDYGAEKTKISFACSAPNAYSYLTGEVLKFIAASNFELMFDIVSSIQVFEGLSQKKYDFGIVTEKMSFPGIICKNISTEHAVLASISGKQTKRLLLHPEMIGMKDSISAKVLEVPDYVLIAHIVQNDPEAMALLPERLLQMFPRLQLIKRFVPAKKIYVVCWPGSSATPLVKIFQTQFKKPPDC